MYILKKITDYCKMVIAGYLLALGHLHNVEKFVGSTFVGNGNCFLMPVITKYSLLTQSSLRIYIQWSSPMSLKITLDAPTMTSICVLFSLL